MNHGWSDLWLIDLETDVPSGRTKANKDSSSDISSMYKCGQTDGSSVKTNYLRSSSRSSSKQTNLCV